jgi:iron complex outermembrane receptor protein
MATDEWRVSVASTAPARAVPPIMPWCSSGRHLHSFENIFVMPVNFEHAHSLFIAMKPSLCVTAMITRLIKGGGAGMRLIVAVAGVCLGAASLALADSSSASVVRSINVQASDLGSALKTLSKESGLHIVYISEDVGSQHSDGAVGELTTEDALKRLLKGTGLTYRYLDRDTVTIMPIASSSGGAEPTTGDSDKSKGADSSAQEGKRTSSSAFRVAQVDQGANSQPSSVKSSILGSQSTVGNSLSEIVVTAQKREERLQDVPMSLTALSGDQLTRTQAYRFEDYVGTVPGLTLINYGALGSQLVIRGITSGDTAVNSSVATYIDETPYTAEGPFAGSYFIAPNLDTFDMQRIEVLRGPQGTLYGANALGGLLKYVTNAPDPSGFDAQVETGGSSVHSGGTGFDVHGMVNLPLASNAAVRLVGSDNYYPGFIDDPSRNLTDINGSRFTGGRASALYNPTDSVSIRFNAFYQDRTWSDKSNEDVNPGTLTPIHGNLIQENLISQPGDSITRLYNVTMSWDSPFAKLLSTTSYLNNQTGTRFDDTGLFGGLFSRLGGTMYGVAFPYDFQMKAFTEEVRLSSLDDQVLQWQVGGFYTNQNAVEGISLEPVAPATRTILGTSPLVSGQDVHPHYRETAGFVSLDYHVTSAFDVGLGGRYSDNEQRLRQVGSGLLFHTLNIDNTSSEGVFTYSGDLRWHVTAEAMLYARIAEGYSPGGPSNVIPAATLPKFYESSTTVNYELGIKSEFLDHRLSVDVSAFLINWRRIQLQAVIDNLATFTNGGMARSEGAEWSLNYAPISGLRLGFNGSYTDAHLTQATPSSVNGQVGDRLPSVPLWQTSANVEYERPLFGRYSGFAGIDYRFTGSRYAEFEAASPRQEMPSFGIFDLRAGVETTSWSVALFAKNVANKLAINYLTDETSAHGSGPQSAAVYQPRTIGLTAAVRF